MRRKLFLIVMNLLFCCVAVCAQEPQKSELEQRAEAEIKNGNNTTARFYFIRAYEDYANKGQMSQAVACGTRGAALYYQKDNLYKEAFDLLRRIDQTVMAANLNAAGNAALRYQTTKERMQMYMKMRRGESVREQLGIMEAHANAANDESVTNDLLYNKAIYYYTFGQNDKGNAVFREMAGKLTAQKEYDKVDEVYKTLIANGLRSGSANMVAQSYSNYMAWKDSVSEVKRIDETDALKQQIAEHEATIADQVSTLSTRWMTIVGLSVLAVALAAVLVVGAIVLMRFIVLSRKQKKTIRQANESNALKAKFISNISAQLGPTLGKLDSRLPEVRALQDFSSHIQMLSELESTDSDAVESEEVQVLPFCEGLMDEIRGKVKANVTLKLDVPKMTAKFNKEYVTHILRHLLGNAAKYAPEGGSVSLEFKKRGAHKFQFLVADTGQGIPEEKRDDVFKPFLEIKDLTQGDGLGLPICKQMALKMNSDLFVDPDFTKGTRLVLDMCS